MARPSPATAALLLLLLVLSLLAVTHCRTIAADHATEPKSAAAVAVSEENELSSNPTLPAEAGASAIHGSEFLRLPSHRLHRHAETEHDEDEQVEELVRRFRKAIMGRTSGHGEDSDDEDEEVEDLVQRFRKAITRRRFGHGEDSDDEDEQVEELVRRFRKVITRRMIGDGAEDSDHHEDETVKVLVWWFRKGIMRWRFVHGHGRRFFHHLHHNHNHSHRHAE